MTKIILPQEKIEEIENWIFLNSNKKIKIISYFKTNNMVGLEFEYNFHNISTLLPLDKENKLFISILNNIKNGSYEKKISF